MTLYAFVYHTGCGLCCHRQCHTVKLPACNASLQRSPTLDAGMNLYHLCIYFISNILMMWRNVAATCYILHPKIYVQ